MKAAHEAENLGAKKLRHIKQAVLIGVNPNGNVEEALSNTKDVQF